MVLLFKQIGLFKGGVVMYLPDNKIRELINGEILNNALLENVQQVSYDLRTGDFHEKRKRCDAVDIRPGNSIFVSSVEEINLPRHLVAQVSLRNSWIRKGLLLDSPVYFPGHKTHIYYRLTNLAGETVHLKKEDGLAQIYFLKVDGEASEDYDGGFKDESRASIIGDMDVYRADDKRMKKAVKPIKTLEQHIYVNVLALLAIFVGISTIAQTVLNAKGVASLIESCLVECASFSVLFLLITLLMPNKVKWWVYCIPIVIVVVCVIVLLKHEAWSMGPLFVLNAVSN